MKWIVIVHCSHQRDPEKYVGPFDTEVEATLWAEEYADKLSFNDRHYHIHLELVELTAP